MQSLLRLTQSTEEEQGQGQDAVSFRALVLNQGIPQNLAMYTLALFTHAQTDHTQTGHDSEQSSSHVAGAPQAVAGTPDTAKKSDDTSESASKAEGVQASASRTVMQSALESPAGTAGTADAAGTAGTSVELFKQGSEDWSTAMQQAGLPWALQLLTAFARRHQVGLHLKERKVYTIRGDVMRTSRPMASLR